MISEAKSVHCSSKVQTVQAGNYLLKASDRTELQKAVNIAGSRARL